MKYTLVSGLGILVVLPAIAGARLPAVNMSAGAVSARAQYGAVTENAVNEPKPVRTISARKLVPVTKNADGTVVKKNVVSRTAKKKSTVSKNTGEKISANAEYLIPNRPSSDLWARADTPLRMPHADEFSVIKSDYELPEENISSFASTSRQEEIKSMSARVSSLDKQLARLIDLQTKAEAAAKAPTVASTRSSVETNIYPAESVAVNRNSEIAPIEIRNIPKSVVRDTVASDDDVKLSRMVVPRDDLIGDDVVVRSVKKDSSAKIQDVREDMSKMTPTELRRAFRKTFLSENKHLSTYPIDDRFDVASDLSSSFEGFTSARDLSEDADKIRPLEIKIRFRNADSALSRDNYNLLSEYAGVVVANPKRAIQVAIPEMLTTTADARKLTARRLAIIEQVLRDTGVSEQRIVPVLSARDDEGFVLRIISNEQYETLTRQKRNMFGDKVSSKTYKSMTW
ncbi:MAG: hypothetical protein J5613_03875 [Alphaproteobacteria bacterium]|nr:hypothetical protein [Alphaproteobacteria bacterium]MBR4806604.1 hypothetical protein [Alphaproteobacteria bacterium]